jgi:hypothetical protein
VTVERIEAMSGGHWADTATQMHAYMCRNGADLYFAWRPGTALRASLDRTHAGLPGDEHLTWMTSGDAVSAWRISIDLTATHRGLRAQYVRPDPR